jgi:hypothetical protein
MLPLSRRFYANPETLDLSLERSHGLHPLRAV